jgi:hypothetical protein
MTTPRKDRLDDGLLLAAMRRTLAIEINALEALSDALDSQRLPRRCAPSRASKAG